MEKGTPKVTPKSTGLSLSPAPLILLRLPAASPKFSSEFRKSAGVCSAAEGGDFPSASRDQRSCLHQVATVRWAGRRQSNSGATRGAAGGAGSDKQPLPARPAPPGARAPQPERRPIPREIWRRLLGLLCL